MYKVTITKNDGRRQVINRFPTPEIDVYSLLSALDRCEIKAFSITLADL